MNRRRRSQGSSTRHYPRTARVNELLREILGEELERIDDPRLELVSITGVVVNPELTSAMVYYSSLSGPDRDPEVLEALAERRVRLQAAIGKQARLRRTPELHFGADTGIREGWRVEEILKEIGPLPEDEPDEGTDAPAELDREDAGELDAGELDGGGLDPGELDRHGEGMNDGEGMSDEDGDGPAARTTD
ncbi:MAG: 30S ribosome-binding factor RbfA [Acidimicrobiales bacterium]|nr:30S ribosome-binding factor RbfA [Acidimicrobiales bacterium]